MSDIHITPELLEAVKRGDVPAGVLRGIVWQHLTHLCPTCRDGYELWQSWHRRAAQDDSAFRVLPMLLQRHVREAAGKRRAAERDVRALLDLSAQARLETIRRAHTRFRGVILADLLLAEAKKQMPAYPQRLADLTEAAEAVLLHTHQGPGYFDALARATAYKANAQRAMGRLRVAEERIAGARQLIRHQDVSDILVYAETDWIEGILRKDQRRFAEAEELLGRSAMLYRLAVEPVEASRTLITLGAMYHHRQETVRAIEVTREALSGFLPESEPWLYLCGRHNLALFLTESGQHQAAADLLLADEALYQEHSDPWTRLRHLWLKGRIAFGTGQLDEAERTFLDVRDGFLQQGIGYDAAMVSMDLALVYLKRGQAGEVRRLAEEMHPIFAAEDVHREALAALNLFQTAARQGAASVDLVEALAGYLRSARENPELRFSRPAGDA